MCELLMVPDKNKESKSVGITEIAAGTIAGTAAALAGGSVLAVKQITDLCAQFSKSKEKGIRGLMEVISIMKQIESYGGPLNQPLVAFRNASTSARIGIGVIVPLSAIGTGHLIHNWRNRDHDTHTDRVVTETKGNDVRNLG